MCNSVIILSAGMLVRLCTKNLKRSAHLVILLRAMAELNDFFVTEFFSARRGVLRAEAKQSCQEDALESA